MRDRLTSLHAILRHCGVLPTRLAGQACFEDLGCLLWNPTRANNHAGRQNLSGDRAAATPVRSTPPDVAQKRMQTWAEIRRRKLQALPNFPKQEIVDPYHEQVQFEGPRKQFLLDGMGWAHSLQQNTENEVPVEDQKLLQVAVVGVPNAGKSSLVNALVGSKVAAVSKKTNTTTAAGLGAFLEGESQVALFDTPGVVDARHVKDSDQRLRVRSAWSMAGMCDLMLLIIDAHRQVTLPDPRVVHLVEELAAGPIPNWSCPPCLLVLNKVDLFAGADRRFASVTALQEKLQLKHPFEEVYPFSVTKGIGLDTLKSDLVSRATPGEWLLPGNETVDLSPAKLCEEIIREKAYERLYREVPYALRFERTAFRIAKNGDVLIKFNILVPNRHARVIAVGKHGSAIGEIGIRARRELEGLFRHRVHLFLDVIIRPESKAR
ncbi:hypothetical protein WJX73_009051 [Symbiochloris irregularis]|uniref:Uncharacterized protein n=1 Tax=Symbiochloris irregularis TaxID=706552 RepID=A0AAW1NSK9_9CHLO